MGQAALALLPMAAGLAGLVYGATVGRRHAAERIAERIAELEAEVEELNEACAEQFLLGMHRGFAEGQAFAASRLALDDDLT
jgi:hypothetical protein